MIAVRQGLLNALDGICYVADADGQILEIGEPAWSKSLQRLNAAGHSAASFIGRNLFDIMKGAEVRATYRAIHSAVLRETRPHVSFELRCDSPDVRRVLRMSISALREAGSAPAVLYQSQVLSAVSRPWMSLFDAARIVDNVRQDAGLSIVRVCSFCQRVAPQTQNAQEWLPAEDYYRLGGPAEVRVSHGVCPRCTGALSPAAREDRQ